jgi:Asp-tRNA(Asn)/Glu-tRNA(Gln) amidotransferase A subunit family amidase
MSNELWRWDTQGLAHAVRNRGISSREAVASCLARPDAINPRLNAVVDILADQALADADKADAAAKEERAIIAQLASVQGPLARSIRDLRIGLRAMAARDARDPWWVPAGHEHGEERRPCRIAMVAELPGVARDEAVSQALRQSVKWLEDAGYKVEEVTPPLWNESADLWALLLFNEVRFSMMPAIEAHSDEATKRAARAMVEITPAIDFDGFRHEMARRATILRERMRSCWHRPHGASPFRSMPTSMASRRCGRFSQRTARYSSCRFSACRASRCRPASPRGFPWARN